MLGEYFSWAVVLLFSARVLTTVINYIWLHFLRPPCNFRAVYGGGEGLQSWALVTGSAAGIGRAFAIELARAGFSLILLDHCRGGLDKLRSELETIMSSDSKIVLVEADASQPETAVKLVTTKLVEHNITEIRLLINNVGVRTSRIALVLYYSFFLSD